MRLASFDAEGKARIGIVRDGGLIDLTRHAGIPATMIGLIEAFPQLKPQLEALADRAAADYRLDQVQLKAPVPRPSKILAIGLNYADHIAETGREPPKDQVWFPKLVNAINGPFDPIVLPLVSQQVDYEGELVFIIAKRCRHVPRATAHEAVFGYCVGNDVSARDWQFKTSQYTLGKSFDTHAPFGPWITTADEIADPHALDIRTFVNGQPRQHSNTRHLIFNIFDQIAHLTQAVTLEPGDVIYTGTPSGVGAAMDPPRFLQAGDVVRVEIDGLGHIEGLMQVEADRPL